MMSSSERVGFVWRMRFLKFVLLMFAAGLLFRAAHLQTAEWGSFLRSRGAAQSVRARSVQLLRGRIYDRSGFLLSASVPRATMWAIPSGVNLADEPSLDRVALVAGLPVAEVRRKLSVKREYVLLKRNLDLSVAAGMRDLDANGIHFDHEAVRVYPAAFQTLAILGQVNSQGQGISGIELLLNASLAGPTGMRRMTLNRFGTMVDEEKLLVPAAAEDARVTLDVRLQILSDLVVGRLLDEAHGANASLLLLDAATGEMLAAVQRSATDEPAAAPGDTPIVSRTFEPGFTLAPFVLAAGLQRGAFSADTLLPKATPALAAIVGDTAAAGDGLPVSAVLTRRSRLGLATAGMQIRQTDLWQTLDAIGIGHDTSLGIPGANNGRLLPLPPWRVRDQALIISGRRVRVTLPQLARAYAALAMHGNIHALALIQPANETEFQSVFGTAVASSVLNMLRSQDQRQHKLPRPGSACAAIAEVNEIAPVRLGVTQRRKEILVAGISLEAGHRIVGAALLEVPSASAEHGEARVRAALTLALRGANELLQRHMTLSALHEEADG